MNLKSRILEFIPKDCMLELDAISRDVLIPDNNTKVDKMIGTLSKYDVPFQELGPGTNRLAVFIDGYVFKIALDKDGKRDNLAEFSMSQELQPFVIKVYECNGLIIVTEYVTVISKEEFMNSKDQIRETLSYLAEGYLLGDVGSISKNFVNWGYRDDGSLVILDFAYIYRVLGNEMTCGGLNKDNTICKELLEYDENFNNLICPRCRKSYTFHDIRRKISKDYETKELNAVKQIAFKVTKPNQEVNTKKVEEEPKVVKDTIDTNYGGNTDMSKKKMKNYYDDEYTREDDLNDYLAAMEFMKNEYDKDHHICECECDCNCKDYDETNEFITSNESHECIEVTNIGYDNSEKDNDVEPDEEVNLISDNIDEDNEELTQDEINALNLKSPIEEASEHVEEYLDGDENDSEEEFEPDPEDKDIEDSDEELKNQDECIQVKHVLGAGVEFIDIKNDDSKEDDELDEDEELVDELDEDEELDDSSSDVLVLTDSNEEAEKLRQILIADNDDYDDEYDDMHEQALRDSKIPKRNNLK